MPFDINSRNSRALVLAASWGATSGVRSMLAPALVSTELRHRISGGRPRKLFPSPRGNRLLQVLAVLELLLDKTPLVPARVAPPALLGRVLSGAIVGAASAPRRRRLWVLPPAKVPRLRLFALGAVGAGAALAATVATYHVRRAMSERLGLSSAAAGLLEDGLALLAISGLRRLS